MMLVPDLYAGPGGWDVAASALDIRTAGLELDEAACLTGVAAGNLRVRTDVETYPPEAFAGTIGLIGSPPCGPFSAAGKRGGMVDFLRAHDLIDAYAKGDDDPGAGWADPRTHHVAQPVRWARVLRPEWIALEQVPAVLPLWQHLALVLRAWGYSTWTGKLNAADYGVPQTRERAFLIASRVRNVTAPTPTHAERPEWPLVGDPLAPWVSMAEALGWADDVEVVSNYGTNGDPRLRGRPTSAQPGASVTSKVDRNVVSRPARTVCGDRSPRWAYPQASSTATGWTLQGNQRPGGQTEYQRRDVSAPAQTIPARADLFRWSLRVATRTALSGFCPTATRPTPAIARRTSLRERCSSVRARTGLRGVRPPRSRGTRDSRVPATAIARVANDNSDPKP